MKNITVSLDDHTYKRARVVAAERGTSVSALVRQFLVGLGKGVDPAEQLKRAEQALRDDIADFRGGDRLPREAAHLRERPTEE